jgi:anaerobic magnesium-protoporphyrin IX monomethyl ester cyclase
MSLNFLFVHTWQGFSPAEWHLREAVDRVCRAPISFHSLDIPPARIPANDFFLRALASVKPDVVGFSCYYWNLPLFTDLAHLAKQVLPAARIIFGGPHIGSERFARHLLQANLAVDAAAIGRSGETLPAFLNCSAGGGNFSDLQGVIVRKPDGSIGPFVPQVEAVPRGIIFHRENHALAACLERVREVSYETVSGCRSRCAYCVYPGAGLASLDDDLVRKELTFICASGVPILRMADAHFGGTRHRAKSLLKLLVAVNRTARILIYPDLLHIDAEYISLMLQSRVEPTSIGVQTTNPTALAAVSREPATDRLEAVRLLLAAFPDTAADVIIGLPGDDPGGLQKTLEDVIDWGFNLININRLALFPGTSLAESDEPWRRSVFEANDGQVISADGWPLSSLEETAALENGAGIAMRLTGCRKLLAVRGKKASLLLQIARKIPSERLHEWNGWFECRSREMLRLHIDVMAREIGRSIDADPELVETIRSDIDALGALSSWPSG